MSDQHDNTFSLGPREFIYRLFFTRSDDLDVLQVLFTLIVLVTLGLCIYVILLGVNPEVARPVLETLRWLLGLLVLTAVPRWLVPYMTKRKDLTTDEV